MVSLLLASPLPVKPPLHTINFLVKMLREVIEHHAVQRNTGKTGINSIFSSLKDNGHSAKITAFSPLSLSGRQEGNPFPLTYPLSWEDQDK